MRNRIKDTLYSGVDVEKIKSKHPIIDIDALRRYAFYQKERTSIYHKKEVLKLDAPWTDDYILHNYRFTNTRRELDRESRYLIKTVLENDTVSYEDKLLNCIVFRIINKAETMEILGAPLRFTEWEDPKEEFERRRSALTNIEETDPNYVFFSAAYILGGVKGTLGREVALIENAVEPNMVMRMVKYVYYNKDEILTKIKNAETQEEVFKALQSFKGFGKFIAYQQFVDFTYIKTFPFSENEFVVSGPGCDRGIDWMCSDRDDLTCDEFMFWFRDNIDRICKENDIEWDPEKWFEFLPPEDRNWGMMQIENSFCEFDKYSRTLLSGKRPKQKFKTNKGLSEW